MTALLLKVIPFVEMVAPKIQTAYRRLLHALEVFAEASMRKGVPARHLGKAKREINRYSRLMHSNLFSLLHDTLAEARETRVRLEAELFHGRYHLSSKNDDDLPIVR